MELNHPELLVACNRLVNAREEEAVWTKIKKDSHALIEDLVDGEIEVPDGEGITMPGFVITFTKGRAINKDERFKEYLIRMDVDPEVIQAATTYSTEELGEGSLIVKRGK